VSKNKGIKRFKLFDYNRNGAGVSKNKSERLKGTLKGFFISYKDNIGKLISVNIFMVLGNFPLIFLIAALAGMTKISAFVPMNDLFQNLHGVIFDSSYDPASMALYGLYGIQNELLVPTVTTYVFYGISALALFSFGFVNVGTAYILRNIAKGDPIFPWSDFWYAVKRNWRQALIFGIIDGGIIFLLCANIYWMTSYGGVFFTDLMFWSNIVIFILYFCMRFYVYVQMVTFKLSLFKIIKNSLIFALVGFKRNFVALIGIIILALFNVLLFVAFNGYLISFAVAVPLILFFSSCAYMKIYASYFKIKAIMIDPYYEEHPDEAPDNEEKESEQLMTDDVTEKERLDEIKKRNGIPTE
jgi:uncharacterized membrane protein YesL